MRVAVLPSRFCAVSMSVPDSSPAATELVAAPLALHARGAAAVPRAGFAPLAQGDALSGLTLAVAGVGPAGGETLPKAVWPAAVGSSDAWAVAVDAESGWYVLLSQDCDIVSDAADEPTIAIAPLVLVSDEEWADLHHNGYSARKAAYPSGSFDLPEGLKLAVDLAWTTSVLKGSIHAPAVQAARPLTGPQQREFGEWLAARTGRIPFPDDVVRLVLDPCYDVRERLLASAIKAERSGATAKLEARSVFAATRWYAHLDGRLVTVLGALTGTGLHRAGFVRADGSPDTDNLAAGVARIQAEVIKRMNKADAHSGYQIKIVLIDLTRMPAADFVRFALLLR